MTIELNDRVTERLQHEQIIWLTTVRTDGMPTPTPVWFHWDGAQVLIFSQPNALKVRNIRANPNVALHFHTDAEGGDVAILLGTAQINEPPVAATQLAAYLAKYTEGIKMINMTPESLQQAYSTALRVTPTHLRTW